MIPDGTETRRAKASQARRQTFVAAARDAFFSKGYGGASMSSIAAKVGGSKTTLWTYFPSKEALFAAVVDDLVERHGRALEVPLPPDSAPADSLRRIGRALLETLHARPIIDLHRLTIGEAGRFPALARLFHERAPARGKARLRDYVSAAMERGQLRQGDPAEASRLFVGMLQAGSVQLHLFGLTGTPHKAELERELDAALDAFMRAWGSHPV